MFGTILDWLMMLFALGSGVAKTIGIQAERQGAEQFGIDYNYIIVMGALQLLSVPLIYFNYYLAGVVLLGLPYLYFVYAGLVHGQYVLSVFSFVIFGVTVFRWLGSIWNP